MKHIAMLNRLTESHGALRPGKGMVSFGTAHQSDRPWPEAMVVAFRDPRLTPAQAVLLRQSTLSKVGTRYSTVGVVLSAAFVLDRRVCELPLLPGPVRDACVRGLAIVQLGASRDDRFFCSQFVLQACAQAGAPLGDADPRWVSPADLLHMREGDVATLAAARPLRYVRHLEYSPHSVAVSGAP